MECARWVRWEESWEETGSEREREQESTSYSPAGLSVSHRNPSSRVDSTRKRRRVGQVRAKGLERLQIHSSPSSSRSLRELLAGTPNPVIQSSNAGSERLQLNHPLPFFSSGLPSRSFPSPNAQSAPYPAGA